MALPYACTSSKSPKKQKHQQQTTQLNNFFDVFSIKRMTIWTFTKSSKLSDLAASLKTLWRGRKIFWVQ
ncbi:hypothetical protein ACQ4LE_003724 [Meloidogyne hapla]